MNCFLDAEVEEGCNTGAADNAAAEEEEDDDDELPSSLFGFISEIDIILKGVIGRIDVGE